MFVVFINELPTLTQSNIKLFADDSKMYRPIVTLDDAQLLQDDLATLEQWSDKWLLRFNATKCKIMHCGANNPKDEYLMKTDGSTLVSLSETLVEKDLEVHVSNTLKLTTHCHKAANKAMSALRLLRTSFDNLNENNFRPLYTTYVRPHLEYCLQAVGPFMVQDFKALEKVQRRATKLVKNIRHLSYEEHLQKLKLLSIKE